MSRFDPLTHSAQAHWRNGEFARAREYAERVVQVVESGSPTTHYVIAGLVGVTEVLIEMAGNTGTKLLRKQLRPVCGQVRRLMMMYPIARPAGHLILGQFHQACGRKSRAIRHWHKGIKAAQQLGMPLEESWLTNSVTALRS
jgi:D-aminopeptidase